MDEETGGTSVGIYAHRPSKAGSGSNTDMNGDGKMDLGRLPVCCYRYRKREGLFLKRVAFRVTRTQAVERDTNQDGNFDARDRNRSFPMPSVVVERRVQRLVATLAIALTVPACGSEPSPTTIDTVADNAMATVTRVAVPSPRAQAAEPEGIEPPSATLAELGDIQPGMETPGTEMPADQAYGRWKVIDAAGAPGGRVMIGRSLSFTDDALGWIDANGKVEPGCPDMYHIALEAMQVKQAAPLFRPGWAKFRLPPDQVGPMHVMECDGEGIFGPPETGGSNFFPVGKDRMVMNWLDGTVLLLRKEGGRS